MNVHCIWRDLLYQHFSHHHTKICACIPIRASVHADVPLLRTNHSSTVSSIPLLNYPSSLLIHSLTGLTHPLPYIQHPSPCKITQAPIRDCIPRSHSILSSPSPSVIDHGSLDIYTTTGNTIHDVLEWVTGVVRVKLTVSPVCTCICVCACLYLCTHACIYGILYISMSLVSFCLSVCFSDCLPVCLYELKTFM